MSSSEIEIFSEREETELIGVNESKERRISSKVRERFSASFLEAKEAPGVLLQSRIPVDLKGNTHKPSTEFSVGRCDPGKNTFSCYIEDKKYFLCAENNEVFLMCSDGCDPNDDKFLFKVDKVDRRTQNSKYSTIQSAKTEQFLISDESGNASMKEITDHTDGPTSDRQAWFQFIPDQRRYSLSWQN
ncbi:unnamed protein product [Porites lobata]|uniref:Uncharacterized protein n=1 Tax=Porites lobata TaxID=104759 RepID=A0ABN8RBU6_9CNID|nr:unnamed protein product [Porites lobata]